MKIEIVGLPGVGKTHIMNALITQHPELGKFCVKNIEETGYEPLKDYYYYFRHPRLTYYTLFQNDRAFIFKKFSRVIRREMFFRAKEQFISFDCGIIQPLLEAYILFEYGKRGLDWLDLLFELIDNCHYIFIHDSMDAIIARELGRPIRHFPSLGHIQLRERYAECERLIRALQTKARMTELDIRQYVNTAMLVDHLYQLIIKD